LSGAKTVWAWTLIDGVGVFDDSVGLGEVGVVAG
jgi:hypothetical protein